MVAPASPCHLLQLVARGLYSGTLDLPSCLIPRVLQMFQRKLKLGSACNEKLQRRGTVTSAPEGMRVVLFVGAKCSSLHVARVA